MADFDPITDEIPSELLDEQFREALIHQAVVTYQSNQRRGLAHTKSKPQVSGPNKKPWRQKGTGRSRHGSQKTPLWVGGARAHGPSGERNFNKKMTKQMKKKARASALAVRIKEEAALQWEPPSLEEPSTANIHEIFEEEALTNRKILLLLSPQEQMVRLSTRNLPYCSPEDAASLNTFQIVAHDVLIFTKQGLSSFVGGVHHGS